MHYPETAFRMFICVVLTCLFAAATTFADTVVPKAQPKTGRTFTPPLSERIPDAIKALPTLGTLTWATHQLPWVGEGPGEGISGIGMVEIDGIIYVVGGFIPGGDETDDQVSRRTSRWTWSYNPATTAWTRLADAPIRRPRASLSGPRRVCGL